MQESKMTGLQNFFDRQNTFEQRQKMTKRQTTFALVQGMLHDTFLESNLD
jgi:hypothetical protein